MVLNRGKHFVANTPASWTPFQIKEWTAQSLAAKLRLLAAYCLGKTTLINYLYSLSCWWGCSGCPWVFCYLPSGTPIIAEQTARSR